MSRCGSLLNEQLHLFSSAPAVCLQVAGRVFGITNAQLELEQAADMDALKLCVQVCVAGLL